MFFFHHHPVFQEGNGIMMIVQDVAYSLQCILDPAMVSPGGWIFIGCVDSLQPFTAINDTVFQLKLKRPFPPIMGILSMHYCSVLPKEVVDALGKDYRRQPCGTGLFKFQAWEKVRP
jgi:peptide/nickel transport system substrate-binding protein